MKFLGLLIPAVAAAAVPAVEPRQKVDSVPVTIQQVAFSGNGCPQGSVSTSISSDGTVVTFGFDQFQTYIGPGTSIKDRSKNCELHLTLKYPGGFSFAVVDSTYHGYAQLDAGVTGTFFSTYYFSSTAAQTTTTRTTIAGGGVWAGGQVYTKTDSIPAASQVRTPCGSTAILNVNNRVALTSSNSAASGQLTDDDATVAFNQQVHIIWYKC